MPISVPPGSIYDPVAGPMAGNLNDQFARAARNYVRRDPPPGFGLREMLNPAAAAARSQSIRDWSSAMHALEDTEYVGPRFGLDQEVGRGRLAGQQGQLDLENNKFRWAQDQWREQNAPNTKVFNALLEALSSGIPVDPNQANAALGFANGDFNDPTFANLANSILRPKEGTTAALLGKQFGERSGDPLADYMKIAEKIDPMLKSAFGGFGAEEFREAMKDRAVRKAYELQMQRLGSTQPPQPPGRSFVDPASRSQYNRAPIPLGF